MSILENKFKIGDKVRLKEEYYNNYNESTLAMLTDELTVTSIPDLENPISPPNDDIIGYYDLNNKFGTCFTAVKDNLETEWEKVND